MRINFFLAPNKNDNLQFIPQKSENINLPPFLLERCRLMGGVIINFIFVFSTVNGDKLMF